MSRLAALLAQAGLANRDLDIARTQADRDVQNYKTASQALQGLVPAAAPLYDIYQKNVDDEAKQAAEQAALEHKNDVGAHAQMDVPAEGPETESGQRPTALVDDPNHFAETPEQLAVRVVGGNKALQAPAKTGNTITDFLNDPLGIKARAATKARLAAEQGITSAVGAARDKAQAEGRQASIDAQNAQKATEESALRTAQVGEQNALASQHGQETKAAAFKQARADALTKAAAMMVRGASGADLDALAQSVGLADRYALIEPVDQQTSTELQAKAKAKGADNLQNSEIAKNFAEAAKENAAAKAAAAGGAGKPLDESARKDIATLQSQLDQAENLKAQKGSVDTGKLSAFQNSLAQFMGIDDPTKTQFRANSAALRDELLHALSGAAVSASEMSRLMEGLPSFTDNDEAYTAKLEATQNKLANLLKNRVNVERASGANVSGITIPTTSQAAPSGALIRVRLSDGRSGRIPESSFDPSTMVRL